MGSTDEYFLFKHMLLHSIVSDRSLMTFLTIFGSITLTFIESVGKFLYLLLLDVAVSLCNVMMVLLWRIKIATMQMWLYVVVLLWFMVVFS